MLSNFIDVAWVTKIMLKSKKLQHFLFLYEKNEYPLASMKFDYFLDQSTMIITVAYKCVIQATQFSP